MADGTMLEASDAVPTALYRHYDKGGQLLYVGISLSPTYRLSQHREGSHWFTSIAQITIEWLPTREAAMQAERAAIQTESPKFNVTHNRPALPEEVEARVQDSRSMLTRRMVSYKPMYKLKDAAEVLGIGSGKLRMAVEHGDILAVEDNGRKYITGWSLLSYMEALELGVVSLRKMPAHNPHGPAGAPTSAASWCRRGPIT